MTFPPAACGTLRSATTTLRKAMHMTSAEAWQLITSVVPADDWSQQQLLAYMAVLVADRVDTMHLNAAAAAFTEQQLLVVVSALRVWRLSSAYGENTATLATCLDDPIFYAVLALPDTRCKVDVLTPGGRIRSRESYISSVKQCMSPLIEGRVLICDAADRAALQPGGAARADALYAICTKLEAGSVYLRQCACDMVALWLSEKDATCAEFEAGDHTVQAGADVASCHLRATATVELCRLSFTDVVLTATAARRAQGAEHMAAVAVLQFIGVQGSVGDGVFEEKQAALKEAKLAARRALGAASAAAGRYMAAQDTAVQHAMAYQEANRAHVAASVERDRLRALLGSFGVVWDV